MYLMDGPLLKWLFFCKIPSHANCKKTCKNETKLSCEGKWAPNIYNIDLCE